MQTLTPGKWRGLQSTSTDSHRFSILAFDQRGSYRRMLPDNTPYDDAVQIKRDVVGVLSRQASAVLLDPDYGLTPAAYMASGSGLLLSAEKSGYSGDSTYRSTEFEEGWDVAKIKRAGAEAVKLMVYYHPGSGELADQLDDLVRGVIEDCRKYDLPLFLEPMSYSLDPEVKKESPAYAATRREVVVETARRLSALQPEVLKLEFPLEVAVDQDEAAWRDACNAVTAASSVPWVLLSAGVDFETFERQVRVACECGASGFLAGRAIWKESVTMSPDERAAFLESTAVPRIKQLIDITEELARPWTEFYAPTVFTEGWYADYAAM